jgi:hypothetical protein
MIVKATLMYNCETYGWSETYYRNETTLAQGRLAAIDLADARHKPMGGNVILKAVRVSDDAVRGDSLIAQPAVGNDKDILDQGSDMPWNCWMLRAEAGAGVRRAVHLRGFPDNLIFLPEDKQNAMINKLCKAFSKYLVDNSWCIRHIDRSGANPSYNIVNVSGAANALVTVQTATVHAFTNGEKVTITGLKSVPKLNGTYFITVTDSDKFVLRGTADAQPVYLGGGKVIAKRYAASPMTNVELIGQRLRKVGRPFGLVRGTSKRKIG